MRSPLSPSALVASVAGGAGGGAPLHLAVGLALATLVSEDLTCIAAGLLVAHGRLGFPLAAGACFVGILVGDLLLVAAGRWLGRPAIDRRPLRWLVTPAAVERAEGWFRRRGIAAVFLSRFVPGTRFALYLAAGVLRAPFGRLAAAMAAAGLVWTPALVALSAATGGAIRSRLAVWSERALPLALAAALVVLVVVKVLLPALTWRGRRLLLSRWRRLTTWEFWPLWLFQIPVVLHWLWLGLRHRNWTLFTAANPGIPAGGFVLESKSAILGAVGERDAVPALRKLVLPDAAHERVSLVRAAHAEASFGFPVVGKPDVGERGEGVTILRDAAALDAWAERAPREAILQRYVAGVEYGVFYARRPDEPEGWIFSITAKELPTVSGDGGRTLEELILADDRAVSMAPTYFERNAERLDSVPAAGARVRLVEIGNHCRGAIFRDGRPLATPALARRIDEIAQSFPGFHFGRFDVRAPSPAAFRDGRGLQVLEINGVTSEATHIYAPGASLLAAYRTLFAQWRLCFEIGAANAARGARIAGFGELVRLLVARRRHAAAASAPPSGAR
ncbi:MAG TPA: VTT domain-containing protein [Thermoanaerobaculia bacterium]